MLYHCSEGPLLRGPLANPMTNASWLAPDPRTSGLRARAPQEAWGMSLDHIPHPDMRRPQSAPAERVRDKRACGDVADLYFTVDVSQKETVCT